MINFILIVLFSFLSSCASVELAANLGKKVFVKKDQLKNQEKDQEKDKEEPDILLMYLIKLKEDQYLLDILIVHHLM